MCRMLMGRVLVDQGDVVRAGSNSGCNSMTHRSTYTRQTKRYRNIIIGVCMVSDMIDSRSMLCGLESTTTEGSLP